MFWFLILHGDKKWYFVTKIVLTWCKKNFLLIEENFSKFEDEGIEFEIFVKLFWDHYNYLLNRSLFVMISLFEVVFLRRRSIKNSVFFSLKPLTKNKWCKTLYYLVKDFKEKEK